MKRPIKILLAEDEKPLRDHLKTLLKEAWPDARVCAEAANGRQAIESVQRHQPQVAFLDIKMPGVSGMAAAREIAGQCHIVFVTAYDQYAIEAFEQAAVDYLLKPVALERLRMTVERLRQRLDRDTAPADNLVEVARRILSQVQDAQREAFLQWILVHHKDEIRLVPVASVCFFKAEEKYTPVMTPGEEFLIRTSIKELTAQLDPDHFWQIHRGTIVNIHQISGISRSATGRGALKLKDCADLLTISRPFLHLFKQL